MRTNLCSPVQKCKSASILEESALCTTFAHEMVCFGSTVHLISHMKYYHDRPHSCTLCDFKGISRENLKSPSKRVHDVWTPPD